MEVSYRKRFEREYGSDAEIERAKKEKNRPVDFKRIFSGNTDECFRIGISFLTKEIGKYFFRRPDTFRGVNLFRTIVRIIR